MSAFPGPDLPKVAPAGSACEQPLAVWAKGNCALFIRELQHESARLKVPNLIWLSCLPESGCAPLAVRANRNVPLPRAPPKLYLFAPGRNVKHMDPIGVQDRQGPSIKTQ